MSKFKEIGELFKIILIYILTIIGFAIPIGTFLCTIYLIFN